MEGYIYYWLMWSFWIILTFFFPKTNERFLLSFFILADLSVSAVFIHLPFFRIGLAFLLFVMLGVCLLRQKKHLLYSAMAVLIIAIAYAGVKLVHLIDPVWFVIDVSMILSFLCCFLAVCFSKEVAVGASYLILGCCYGEIVFSLTVSSFHRPVIIGDPSFLDLLTMGLFCLLLWFLMKSIAAALEFYVKKNVKEKHEYE